MVKLNMIYNPRAIMNVWGYLQTGVQELIVHSNQYMSESKLLNQLLSGEKLLWVCTKDEVYMGFITTQVIRFPGTIPTVEVTHAYIKKGADPEVFYEGLDQVKDYAKDVGCKRIRFYSMRKGFERKIPELKKGYTEYFLDL